MSFLEAVKKGFGRSISQVNGPVASGDDAQVRSSRI